MARTVKVGLDVNEQPFVRGMDRAAGAAGRLEDALDDVTDSAKDTATGTDRASDSADDLGDSAKEAARELDRLRTDAARLDAQIDDTARGIRDLAREIARTSDEAERAKLAEKLTVERGRLRQQVDLRKLIDVDSAQGMGEELASQVSVSFAARLGPLIARAPMAGMNPAVAAIGAPLVAGLVTLIGTAVGGAIVGGVGVGGVIGGVKLAARDPAVQAAGTELGEKVAASFGRSSSAFVPETLSAIDSIGDRVETLEPKFKRAFTGASRHVDPLLDGLLDAGERALPGVIDAIEAAGPVIDAVADGVSDLGDAFGDGLSMLADDADSAGRALDVLFFIMESGVRSAFYLVNAMSELYRVSELVGALITGDIPRFWSLVASQKASAISADDVARAQEKAAESSTRHAQQADRAAGGVRKVGDAAAEATPKIQTYTEFLNESLGRASESAEASIRAGAAYIRLGEAAKEGAGKGIDPLTEAGNRNFSALKAAADAANANAAQILKVTGNHQLAAQATEEGRKRFLAAADAMGVERGRAVALANSLFGIPNIKRTVTADTGPARRAVQSYDAWLKSVNLDKTSTIYQRVITEQNTARGGPREFNRWGGVYEHAAEGVLREAQIAAPVSPARYAWAEPATGGEAFIPRIGDPQRSLAILETAARWYGATVQPAVTAGSGGGPGVTEVHVYVGDREITDIVDVRISQRDRDLKRRVMAGTGVGP
ncbi:hypothetical protein ACIBCR_16360 [Micromonospora echinospora]|uniref:hypothetical protein n=1 Tax=Micromonospora echinospora TaxID=1877 RepID=UPI0037B4DEF0